MQPKTPKLLADIKDAARFIDQAASDLTLDEYLRDRTIRQAIERNLEIIGEAVGRLARIDPETAIRIGSYEQIISFRNVLIHGYDIVEHEHVWGIIRRDIPPLLETVKYLLREMNDDPH